MSILKTYGKGGKNSKTKSVVYKKEETPEVNRQALMPDSFKYGELLARANFDKTRDKFNPYLFQENRREGEMDINILGGGASYKIPLGKGFSFNPGLSYTGVKGSIGGQEIFNEQGPSFNIGLKKRFKNGGKEKTNETPLDVDAKNPKNVGSSKNTKVLQNLLIKEGYLSSEDAKGGWGPKSQKSLESFQSDNSGLFGGQMGRQLGLPLNVSALQNDLTGIKSPITVGSLSSSELEALRGIVRSQLSKGKTRIQYADYGTHKPGQSPYYDVGGGQGPIGTIKSSANPNWRLKTTLGQANIVTTPTDTLVVDADGYNFNNANEGGIEGYIEDVKRVPSVYNLFRAAGTNFGSKEGEGAPVLINTGTNYEPDTFKKGGKKMKRKSIINTYQNGGSKEVKYGTPEYKEAYDQNKLASVNPYTGQLQGKDLPEFEVEGKRTSMTESGRKAIEAFFGIPAATLSNTFGVPQAVMTEGIEAMRGNPYDFKKSLDVYPGNKPSSGSVFDTKQRVPSETIGFKNPEGFWQHAGNFALDSAADPANLFGMGSTPRTIGKHLLSEATMGLSEAPSLIKQGAKALADSPSGQKLAGQLEKRFARHVVDPDANKHVVDFDAPEGGTSPVAQSTLTPTLTQGESQGSILNTMTPPAQARQNIDADPNVGVAVEAFLNTSEGRRRFAARWRKFPQSRRDAINASRQGRGEAPFNQYGITDAELQSIQSGSPQFVEGRDARRSSQEAADRARQEASEAAIDREQQALEAEFQARRNKEAEKLKQLEDSFRDEDQMKDMFNKSDVTKHGDLNDPTDDPNLVFLIDGKFKKRGAALDFEYRPNKGPDKSGIINHINMFSQKRENAVELKHHLESQLKQFPSAKDRGAIGKGTRILETSMSPDSWELKNSFAFKRERDKKVLESLPDFLKGQPKYKVRWLKDFDKWGTDPEKVGYNRLNKIHPYNRAQLTPLRKALGYIEENGSFSYNPDMRNLKEAKRIMDERIAEVAAKTGENIPSTKIINDELWFPQTEVEKLYKRGGKHGSKSILNCM